MATCGKSTAGPGSSTAVCCPVCYREYSDSDSDLIPRILNCGHSFCTECLGRLLEVEGEEGEGLSWGVDDLFSSRDVFGLIMAGGGLGRGLLASQWERRLTNLSSHTAVDHVTCPICKSTNHIQDGTVTNLTKNFALLGMLQGAERPSLHYCQEHDHEQRIYCQECRQLVCAYCQLYGRHKTHKCLIATEACEPAVEAVRELQTDIETQLEQLKMSEASVLTSVQQLERGRERSVRKVHSYYGGLIEALQQKREAELDKIRSWSDEQAYPLQSQLRSLSGARKTCNRLLEDCRRIADCDPLQALYEQEPLAQRAEDVKAACKGLPSDPLVTPSICSVQLHDIDEHLQALMTGLAVTMSLDPRDQQEEGEGEGEDVTVNSLHAQDTQGTEDQSGGGVNGSKLDSTFLIDPSPSLASPSTPPSYSTTPHYHTSLGAHYSSQHTSHSPNSEDSPENSTGEEFKDIRLRPPVPFLRTSHGFWSDYHIHGRFDYGDGSGDDESDQDVLLEQGCPVTPPSPPSSLPVPSIPPVAGFSQTQEEDQQRVSVSIAGRELHISVSGSSMAYPMLLDDGRPETDNNSDYRRGSN